MRGQLSEGSDQAHWFDHNGYCILYKRLHGALFELPDSSSSDRPLVSIDARALAAIVRGVAK